MRALLGLGLASLAALVASGCGSGARPVGQLPAGPPRPATTTRDPAPAHRAPRPPALVRVRASRYGRILVDARGRTLYLFSSDAPQLTRCAGACAQAWPPFVAATGPGARQGRPSPGLGRVRRANGSLQVTYHGHPLYYYVGDRIPGQILCQNVEEFGGHWWVVSPDGRAITTG